MHYFPVVLRPSEDISIRDCLRVAFRQIHGALGRHGKGDVGVDFPNLDITRNFFGDEIRLMGNRNSLEAVRSSIHGSDLFVTGAIHSVPDTQKYVRVFRVRDKGASALRRSERRGQVARNRDKTSPRVQGCNMGSILSSGGRILPAFLVRRENVDMPNGDGNFSSYGLSGKRTLPSF